MCRQTGWPQGGPLSEPGTLVDLGEDVWHLQTHKDEMSRVGWKVPGKDFELRQVICGLCHVDDALLLSKILCCDCIEAGVGKMWAADVGTSKEEEGNVVRLLHTIVSVQSGKPRIISYVISLLYTLGVTDTQKIARIGHCAGTPMNNYQQIRVYVFCQVLGANNLCSDRAYDLYFVIWSMISEIARLGWLQTMLAKAFRSIPRRHVSKLVIACRLLGRFLKHSSWIQLPHPCNVGFELDPMCCALFKFCLDSHPHPVRNGAALDLRSWWGLEKLSTSGWGKGGKDGGKGWKGPGKWNNKFQQPQQQQLQQQQQWFPATGQAMNMMSSPPPSFDASANSPIGNQLMEVMVSEYQKQLEQTQLEKQRQQLQKV